MTHPLDLVRWLFRNEPAVTLSVCTALVPLIARWAGVAITGPQLVGAIGLILFGGGATRQLVRPDGKAKDQIESAYQLGHVDHALGRFSKHVVTDAEDHAAGKTPPLPYPGPVATTATEAAGVRAQMVDGMWTFPADDVPAAAPVMAAVATEDGWTYHVHVLPIPPTGAT